MDDTTIAERLLDVLRRHAGMAGIDYAARPVRIHGGYDTRIYVFTLHGAPAALSGPLVLRLQRPDTDPAQARREAAIHGAVAGLGYPCPPVLVAGDAAAGLGGAFLIMPRVAGRVMLDALWGPGLVRMPDMLAQLHLALHALDPEPVRHALAAVGVAPERLRVSDVLAGAAQEITAARLDGLRGILEWLTTHRPPEPPAAVVCHGDFHPLNVFVERGRPTGVIDWANLRFGDRAYDVGATLALLTHGPVNVPIGLRAVAVLGRRVLVDAYRRSYLRAHAIDPARLRYYEALRTLGLLVEAGIHHRIAAGVIAPRSKPTAFASRRVLAGAVARIRALTGVSPRLG
jgi:aminoglycoside phosphotransferase (APT) family kinase protein